MTAILSLPPKKTKPVSSQEGWKLLGAVLRAARWRFGGKDERTTLKVISLQTGVTIPTLSALETGQNHNPKVNVFQQIAAHGYAVNPKNNKPYTAAELLAIADGQLQPLNPYTKKPFAYSDFVFLELAKNERELYQQLRLLARLDTAETKRMNRNEDREEAPLVDMLRRWMVVEGLNLETFYLFVSECIIAFEAADDAVTAAGILDVARGLRLPTLPELRFLFVLPTRRTSPFTNRNGEPFDVVNDWYGTLAQLGLAVELYTNTEEHIEPATNGNGFHL